MLSFSSLYLIGKSALGRGEESWKEWGKLEERVKGRVHRLTGALKGFASTGEAALQLTEDTWTLSTGPSRQGYAQMGVTSQHVETEPPPRRFPPVLLGAVPAFCEAGVEVACSFATLYLSNLGKDDLGGQGCLFSLMSSGPPPNAMKLVLSDC